MRERLIAEGLSLLQQGQTLAARQRLEAATHIPGAPSTAWQYLATACARLQDFGAARSAVERAIALGPLNGNLLLIASNVCQDAGDPATALKYAAQSEAIDPSFAQGINNYGILLSDALRYDEAIAAFQRAIKLKPDYGRAYANLAATLLKLERVAEAWEAAGSAVRLQPNYAHGHYMRAACAHQINRTAEALSALQAALQLDPRQADAWVLWARLHSEKHLVDEVIFGAQRALTLAPTRVDARLLLADALWTNTHYADARRMWQEVLREEPLQLEATLRLTMSVPGIYMDAGEVDLVRSQVAAQLDSFETHCLRMTQAKKSDVLRDIQASNFFLAYQGRDDKSLQQRYASCVASILRQHLPQFFEPIAGKPGGTRRRIGFVSRFMFTSTAGNYFASWMLYLPRDRFDVTAFYLGERVDSLTNAISERADNFVHEKKAFESLAEKIKAADLDVLIYPELGMDAKCYALAAMRLAPIQVCGWGHPVTSGHANIDYFLSCAAMEPANAARHYTEKLQLLPGLGTRYKAPEFPSPTTDAGRKTRSDYLLPVDKTLYLLPQSLFKIHPDNDEIITRLLARDPNGVLVMFAAIYPAWTNRFVARLQQSFVRAGLAHEGRVKVLPNMEHADYKRVNQLCDVMIDTLYWSGGNTSLDAIAMGLPVVTIPGEFMRGRQSMAMLELIGLDELVAQDIDAFLEIALRLGSDANYRQSIRAKILDHRNKLFDDAEPTRALADFLERVTA
jgi:protein O-GlcNAc transferase